MSKADPYHDIKPVHYAALMNPSGGVSPLCAKAPRAINLKFATWTNRREAVTCKRCARALLRIPAEGAKS